MLREGSALVRWMPTASRNSDERPPGPQRFCGYVLSEQGGEKKGKEKNLSDNQSDTTKYLPPGAVNNPHLLLNFLLQTSELVHRGILGC